VNIPTQAKTGVEWATGLDAVKEALNAELRDFTLTRAKAAQSVAG